MAMLLLIIVVTAALIQAGTPGCTITSRQNNVHVSCSGLHLVSVPLSVPDGVTHLDFSHNVMTNISFLAFRRFSRIRVLDFTDNTISHVDQNAFTSMRTLEELHLNSNNIGDDSVLSGSKTTDELQPHRPVKRRKTSTASNKEVKRHSQTADTATADSAAALTSRGICNVLLPSALRVLRLDHNIMTTLTADCFQSAGQSLQTLSLQYNRIGTVHNDAFRDLVHLQSLDMRENKLQRLEPFALRGLTSLRTLLLSGNSFRYDETSFPPGVFLPLQATLTSLYLDGNDASGVFSGGYPESAFSDLSALTYLAIDTFPQTTFGHGFAAMRHLTTLDLSNKCRLRTLTNQTFDGFENGSIENLFASECGDLLFVDACAFCPLKNLSNLQMREAYSRILDLNFFFRAFYGFQHRNNLSEANLNHLSSQIRTSVRLNIHTMKYVLNTCVRVLNLARNFIVSIENGAFGWPGCPFSECIEYLDISGNNIWYVDYAVVLSGFAFLPRLDSIRVDNQHTLALDDALELTVSRKEISIFGKEEFEFYVILSSRLRYINVSSCLNELGQFPRTLVFKNGDMMKNLDMSYIRLYGCTTTIMGLGRLETLNLSGNSCKRISDSFFDSFYSLKALVLQKMNFDPLLFAKQGSVLFRNLSRLETLDLSDNYLRHLPFDMLHSQAHLRELILARNKLSGLALDFSRHDNLTLLDLSNNAIPQLSSEERISMDKLAAKQTQPFHIYLHGNSLICTCDTLDFVRWLRITRIRLDNDGDYPCMTDGGQMSTTAAVADHWPFAWRHCVGHTALWSALLVLLLMLLLTGTVWGVAVNVTRLQFLFRVFKKIKIPMRHHFLKDAYVAYCEEDTEWVCTRLKEPLQDGRGLRLLIRHLPRDQAGTQWWELPGENSHQKMLEHMDVCWKVVLVLTSRLARDPSAGFVTRAVLQTITDTMPNRVLLLCVGVTRMPDLASLRALLEVVPENQVFFVPEQAGRHHPVWVRVSEVILS